MLVFAGSRVGPPASSELDLAFVEGAKEWLTDLWKRVLEEDGPDVVGNESVVFLIGWSDTEQEFVAFAFASEQDFKAVRVKNTWIMPSPWKNRPSGLELRRLKKRAAESRPDVDMDEVEEMWLSKAPAKRPACVEEWVQVAKDAREYRSLAGNFGFIIVAGDVFHTRLGRGEITTRRVYRYDDGGEEFARMIEGTQHPQGQMAACPCDSGKTYLDCHLAERYADGHTCDCGSGEPFRDCCMVSNGVTVSPS